MLPRRLRRAPAWLCGGAARAAPDAPAPPPRSRSSSRTGARLRGAPPPLSPHSPGAVASCREAPAPAPALPARAEKTPAGAPADRPRRVSFLDMGDGARASQRARLRAFAPRAPQPLTRRPPSLSQTPWRPRTRRPWRRARLRLWPAGARPPHRLRCLRMRRQRLRPTSPPRARACRALLAPTARWLARAARALRPLPLKPAAVSTCSFAARCPRHPVPRPSRWTPGWRTRRRRREALRLPPQPRAAGALRLPSLCSSHTRLRRPAQTARLQEAPETRRARAGCATRRGAWALRPRLSRSRRRR